eukprot:403336434
MNITKMAYHEPRPYMYDSSLEPYGCSAEYGNPTILVFMSQILTYIIVEATFTPPQKWLDNIATKCHKDIEKDKDILNYKSVVLSGVSVATYGCYLGILSHRKIYGQMWQGIYHTNIAKFILRYLVVAFICLPIACPFFLVPWSAPLPVLILFKTLLPVTVAGFVAYAFTQYFYDKFKLINDKSDSLYPMRSLVNSQKQQNEETEELNNV